MGENDSNDSNDPIGSPSRHPAGTGDDSGSSPQQPQAQEAPKKKKTNRHAKPSMVQASAREGDTESGRLMVKQMVLENFKSYAGRQVIGPFHKQFSAIVGPNGSGKSNTIDALQFVFGRQASKLRQKSVKELIHNSSQFRDLDEAAVHVHFQLVRDLPTDADATTGDGDSEDPTDRYQVVPGSEFVVTRRAYADGKSKYQIDGRNKRRDDVTTLLKQHGVDLDNNRFLILQGEVESIAMMKPKAKTEHETGILEYLEDIIGSNRYVEQIEEQYTAVENANEERAENLNRVKAVERELETLEGTKSEAEDYLSKQHEVAVMRGKLFQLQHHLQQQQMATHRGDAEALETELAERKAAGEDERKAVADAEARLQELQTELEEAQQQLDEKSSAYQKLDNEYTKMKTELKHMKAQEKKLVTAANKSNATISERQATLQSAEDDRAQHEAAVETLMAELTAAEAKLEKMHDEIREQTAGMHRQLREKQQELEPWLQKLNDARAAVDLARGEREMHEEASKASAQRLADAEQQVTELQEQQDSVEKRRQEVTDRIEAATAEQQEHRAAHDEAAKAAPKQQARVAELREQLAEAYRRQQQTRGGAGGGGGGGNGYMQRLVSQLMEAQKGGKLRGVLGRLGDLGTVDEQYDVAVSTGCRQLDSVLVEDTASGRACVDFLKRHQLGQATFVMLDKQQQQYGKAAGSRAPATPEDVPRLVDVIHVADERLRPAFFFAAGTTLVASDLDQATRIGMGGGRGGGKRHRVVTVDGQLVEPTGAMTGGGRQVQRGRMRLRGQDDARNGADAAPAEEQYTGPDPDAINAELATISAQLKATQQAMANSKRAVERLQRQIKQDQASLTTAEADAAAGAERLALLQKQLPELRKQCKLSAADKKLIAEAEKKVKSAEVALAEVEEQARELEEAVAALNKQILDVGGVPMKVAKAKLQSTQEKIDNAQDAITKCEVQEKSLARSIAAMQKTVDKKLAEIEDIRAKVYTKLEESKALEDNATTLCEEAEKLKSVVDEKTEAMRVCKGEFDDASDKMSKVRKAELEVAQQLDDVQRLIAECKAHAGTWQKKLQRVRREAARNRATYFDLFEGDLDGGDGSGSGSRSKRAAAKAKKAATKSQPRSTGRRTRRRRGAGAQESDSDAESSAGEEAEEMMDDSGDGDHDANDNDDDADDDVDDNGDDSDKFYKAACNAIGNLSEDELGDLSKQRLARDIALAEDSVNTMKPNMGAIREYRLKDRDCKRRRELLEEVTLKRDEARKLYDDLRKRRLDEFMAAFQKITMKLKEMYQLITLGGDAELELVDSLDPFSEGVVFSVRPPKKSWKNITNLSGGEKTLASLALVFALHVFKPTPIYIMDEIDAALDYRNVSIVANYIKERTKNAQFIIISLRNNMFELADRLSGIYKTQDQSKSVTINPRSFVVPGGRSVPA